MYLVSPGVARLAAAAILPASLIAAPSAAARFQTAIADRPPAVAIVEVSLAERAITLRAGDDTVASWPIVAADASHPSPVGSFQIRRIVWNPGEDRPERADTAAVATTARGLDAAAGNVKVYFREPGYYIHAVHDGAPIGRTTAHGCIRMRVEDAIELATLVMEHGGEPRSPNWFQRVLNRVTQSRDIRLSTPVRILIS